MEFKKKCPLCKNTAHQIFSNLNNKIYQCDFCKLGFLVPIPSKQFLKKFYSKNNLKKNSSAYGYKNYREMTSSLRMEADRKINFIKKFVSVKSSHLDIGSGLGDFALQARKADFGSEVLDISTWAVDVAKKRGLRGYISDLSLSSLPNKKFKLLTAWDVIEHLRDPLEGMKAFSHLMSKGSHLFLTTPNLDSFERKLMGPLWYGFKKIPEHVFYYSPASLKYLASLCSLEILEVKTWEKKCLFSHS